MRKQLKILQGYIDIAGQASRYAQALRARGVDTESWFYERTLKNESFDRLLDLSKNGLLDGRIRKACYAIQAIGNFTHLHIHKGFSLLNAGRDLVLARRLGVKIVIHYRGSEIRKDMQQAFLEPEVVEKIKREHSFADAILVKDGQLAELIKPYAPDARVFPNIVNVNGVAGQTKAYASRPKLRVVHIPSNPKVKGTEIIRREVSKLHEFVDYAEFTNLPHSELLREYLAADLVIDQVLTGTYGNASLEAMALGTPVLNRLDPRFTAYEPEKPPIVSVEPSDIAETILHFVRNREELETVGQRGKLFIQKHHSSEKVAEELVALYETL